MLWLRRTLFTATAPGHIGNGELFGGTRKSNVINALPRISRRDGYNEGRDEKRQQTDGFRNGGDDGEKKNEAMMEREGE